MSATATSGELVSIEIPVECSARLFFSAIEWADTKQLATLMTTANGATRLAWYILAALPRNVAEEFCYKALKEFRKK